MQTLTSKDGTIIAFDKAGHGSALILVGGAFEQRAMESETAKLAVSPVMTQQFTVYHYDRRGRGDSTDTLPYAVAREIEDIEALIDDAGGTAFVFGISSGAGLAFEAAAVLGDKIKKLAMYEPPYNDDTEARQAWKTFRAQLDETLAAGKRGEAVGLFMSLLGVPAEQLAEMAHYPMWPMWEAVAPTIAYDAAALGEEAAVPIQKAAQISVPTLIMNGDTSYPFMAESAAALASAMPHGQHLTLEGQTHEVSIEALAPVLVDFFTHA